MSAPTGAADAPKLITLQLAKSTLALHLLREGWGRPLLILHGLGERSPASVPEHLDLWSGPVYALDFLGHGGSTMPTGGGYTAEVLMGDVDAAIAHLGPVTVYGRGLGAYIGLLIAGGRPEDVRGVILADGPGLVGGGIRPGSPSVGGLTDPIGTTPDPFALVELARDVRPPDYAAEFVRQAMQWSPLDTPIAVCTVVRPEWLDAVVAEPGVVEMTVADALALYDPPGDMTEQAPAPSDGPELDLLRSLLFGLGDLVVAFDETGTMVYANEASTNLVGLRPDELVGRSVFDFLHADDLERAMMALDLNNEFGSAPGTTMFRVAHADGSWLQVDMTGGHAAATDGRVLYTSSSRRADDRFAITETMLRLLRGSSTADALRPVLDVFAWRQNGSEIGVSWLDGDGHRAALSTGVDLALVGGDLGSDDAADGPGNPWDQVRRTGEPFTDLELAHLGPERARLARARGLCAYWIEPIENGGGERGLLTVWTRSGGRPPLNHAHAMATVKPIAALILRWFEQQRQLDFAAFHDPLTGVANRKRFFDALGSCPGGGAVLYCDLDRFKPVNDELGHAAGDDLLRGVASRLVASVGSADLVARLGGDEFAVLCPGASGPGAEALVSTIEAALREPFTVAGTSVTIGVSVGIGLADDELGDDTLEAADEALYRAKRARGGRRAHDA